MSGLCMSLFLFYQYNDTQLSCVFEKKNLNFGKLDVYLFRDLNFLSLFWYSGEVKTVAHAKAVHHTPMAVF